MTSDLRALLGGYVKPAVPAVMHIAVIGNISALKHSDYFIYNISRFELWNSAGDWKNIRMMTIPTIHYDSSSYMRYASARSKVNVKESWLAIRNAIIAA